jgi:pimeloyl-ACP methyl ester carboxylesterase
MTEQANDLPPIVLIHGLWMTPRSWEEWAPYYRAKGHQVIVPAYPGFEIEVEALREKPEVIAEASVPATLEHLTTVIESLDRPPILMAHSFGGTLTQILINHGLGAAAVVIDSAPPEGVRVNPPSQIKSLFPVLANPANRNRAVGYTKEQFHYTFANTCTREESDAIYDRYHIPAPGNWVWAYGLIANFKPGHQDTWVDYDLDERCPLLFITGGKDHLMPPSVQRSNAKKYRHSTAITDTYEFPDRPHFTCGVPGWEQVADYALEWAMKNARTAPADR